jgi:hypothetical protein
MHKSASSMTGNVDADPIGAQLIAGPVAFRFQEFRCRFLAKRQVFSGFRAPAAPEVGLAITAPQFCAIYPPFWTAFIAEQLHLM